MDGYWCTEWRYPDSKVHGANMGPTWVLSAPDGPHVGPMNLVIRVHMERRHRDSSVNLRCVYTDPRPRPSPGPRPSWKSGWKRTPCKVYGLYWNSGRGRGWRTRTRARPSVNTFDEMLRDFKKRTRTRISVNAPLCAGIQSITYTLPNRPWNAICRLYYVWYACLLKNTIYQIYWIGIDVK